MTPRVLFAAVLAFAVPAAARAVVSEPGPLFAQTAINPVDALARRLAEDPKERAEAGKRLEAFLLNPDSDGRSFVGSDVDRAALGALARDWASKEDARRLATLVFLCSSNSPGEARLRAALSSWTGRAQIQKTAEARTAPAFLADAADKASRVLSDPNARRDIDAAIEAGEMNAPAAPGAREAVERARRLRERRGAANIDVFGPDRAVQDLPAGGARSNAVAGGNPSGVAAPAAAAMSPRGVVGKLPPAAQLPLSQGMPDRINVPAPGVPAPSACQREIVGNAVIGAIGGGVVGTVIMPFIGTITFIPIGAAGGAAVGAVKCGAAASFAGRVRREAQEFFKRW